MTNYDSVLQSFINKQVLQIVVLTVIAALCILLIWLIPVVRNRLSDTHKPGHHRHSRRSRKARLTAYLMKHDTIFVQVVLTAVCLILLVPAIQCVGRINDLRADMEKDSYLTHQGSYSVSENTKFIDSLFGDMRLVKVNGRTDALDCDVSQFGMSLSNGSHRGTVVYGQHSGVVVELILDNK